MANINMVWYKHINLPTRQYCAEGRLDNLPKWKRVGNLELILERFSERIKSFLRILPYQT